MFESVSLSWTPQRLFKVVEVARVIDTYCLKFEDDHDRLDVLGLASTQELI